MMAKFKEANEKIIDGITEGYEKIEESLKSLGADIKRVNKAQIIHIDF